MLECSHESIWFSTQRSREKVWQDVLVLMNYLLVGFGYRATTGSNSMCWQVGWGTAGKHGAWSRWVPKLCKKHQCASLQVKQKPACFAPPYEFRPLWGQLSHIGITVLWHWHSAVCLRCSETYWQWGRCPWGTVTQRKLGHRFSEIHNLKRKNIWII